MILPVRLSATSTHPAPEAISVVATVDTGVPHFCITEALAQQLGLQQSDTRLVRDAEGGERLCSYVGPLLVEARGVKAYMGAVVYGTEVVLGRAALAALGLVADNLHGKVYTDTTPAQLPLL